MHSVTILHHLYKLSLVPRNVASYLILSLLSLFFHLQHLRLKIMRLLIQYLLMVLLHFISFFF